MSPTWGTYFVLTKELVSPLLSVFEPVEPIEGEAGSWSPVRLGFVNQPGHSVYVEWPEGEPMVNVLAVIDQAERGAKGRFAVVFDPEDEDLWEVLVGGYRLHGMFVNELT